VSTHQIRDADLILVHLAHDVGEGRFCFTLACRSQLLLKRFALRK
jgi:hypothetical protein